MVINRKLGREEKGGLVLWVVFLDSSLRERIGREGSLLCVLIQLI